MWMSNSPECAAAPADGVRMHHRELYMLYTDAYVDTCCARDEFVPLNDMSKLQ